MNALKSHEMLNPNLSYVIMWLVFTTLNIHIRNTQFLTVPCNVPFLPSDIYSKFLFSMR